MENFETGFDSDILGESILETASGTDRVVTIERVVSSSGGSFDSVAPTVSYEYYDITALIEEVTPEDVVKSGGNLSIGNVRMTTAFNVQEKREQSKGVPGQEGDVLVMDCFKWRIVGIPQREAALGGLPLVKSYWART